MSMGISQLEDRSWTFKQNITVNGTFTVEGNFTFGDAATDNLIVQGDLRVIDDRFLHFGTDEDVSIEYDEDGNDVLTIIGADWLFGTTVGVTFRDSALKINSSVDGQLDIVADTTVAISGAVTMDSTLAMSGKIILDPLAGAASASGLLMGTGTTASPATTSTADAKFVELRCQTTATSGDSRLLYMRYQMTGINSTGGECIRAFTKLDAACGTVRGAHISLDVDDSPAGSVTGLGVGVDSQLLVGNAALPAGGTYAALQSEIYSAGSSSTVSAPTEVSFLRFSNGGDATGLANVDDNAFLFVLDGGSIGSGNIVEASTTETNYSHTIRIKLHGSTYYLMVANAVG